MKVLADTRNMEHDEWLEKRMLGIGGSDAAAICGLSGWKSPMTVYLEKTKQIEPEEVGEAALWGTKLEDVVAQNFAETTGFKVQRRNAILQHPDYPWMLANVDRLIMAPDRGRGILECKTTNAFNKDVDEDKLPDNYVIQMLHYFAVTGLQFGYLAVLKGGQRYKHQLIERDDQLIANLIEIEQDFWEGHVLKMVPPLMDGSDASTDLLTRLYPTATPETRMTLPESAGGLVDEYERCKVEAKAWDEKAESCSNQLKDMLGNNEVGLIGERQVAWKSVISNRLDTKRFKAEQPQMYAKYVSESASRRFAIK